MRRADLVSPSLFLISFVGCGGQGDADPYDLDFEIPRTEVFTDSLSDVDLFEGSLNQLIPAEDVILYELSSQLFTDYAKKQRLIRLPEDAQISTQDDGRLIFPEGSLIAKTFYYPEDMSDAEGPRRILETRLLVKTEGLWNVATYLWNEAQSDASLLLEGTTTDVSWIDDSGRGLSTEYVVPHEGECVTCHQLAGESVFIGPTLQNLNRNILVNGESINQLDYWVALGMLESGDWSSDSAMPDYEDTALPLSERARAYLAINCAHCHNPDGWEEPAGEGLDLRFDTPLDQSGLTDEPEEVEEQLSQGEMPFLGTTLQHEEGVALVLDYLATL